MEKRKVMLSAALAGLIAAGTAVQARSAHADDKAAVDAADAKAPTAEKDKNSCKGKEGCKAHAKDKNGCNGKDKDKCKGKNSCKGKDGCKAHAADDAAKDAAAKDAAVKKD